MCWTAISYNNGDINNDIIKHALCEEKDMNKDGYAFRAGNEIVRTLSSKEFYLKTKDKKPGVMHLHFRKSTNVISERYIHLWNHRGITFGHNGIIHDIKHPNDSFGFWEETKELFAELRTNEIKQKMDKLKGYGVFTILYPNNTSMIISVGKEIKITRINDGIMFSSDFLEFKNESMQVILETISIFKGFEFKETSKQTIAIKNNSKNLNISTTKKENCMLLIDKDGSLIDEISIDNKTNIYSSLYFRNNYPYVSEISE